MVPLSFSLRVSGAGPLVVCYHTVSDRALPHIRPLFHYCSVRQFEQDLDALSSRFTWVNLEQISQGISGGARLPRNSCHLTFDDGLREVAEVVAPVLARRGIPATFFLNSRFLDNKNLFYRFKSALLVSRLAERDAGAERARVGAVLQAHGFPADDLKARILSVPFAQQAVLDELAPVLGLDWGEYLRTTRPFMDTAEVSGLVRAGFTVGAHSLDHVLYRDLSPAERLRQTREDMDSLAQRFALTRRVFAFPFHAEGVPREFFETLLQDGSIELFFGTSGWYHERPLRLVNRVMRELSDTAIMPLLRQSLAFDMAKRLSRS
jgi:peptidoglycan/xylan/chitin deacetylase (PgdA/CDA1 family)